MSDVFTDINNAFKRTMTMHGPAPVSLLDAASAHLAARDALEGANINSLSVEDPRFAAVADTLAQLRLAVESAR